MIVNETQGKFILFVDISTHFVWNIFGALKVKYIRKVANFAVILKYSEMKVYISEITHRHKNEIL
jgi:hypothetical protein